MLLLLVLVGLAVAAVPGRPRPVGPQLPRPVGGPRRAGRAKHAAVRSDVDESTELFAAALEAGLAPAEATRWCARRARATGPARRDRRSPGAPGGKAADDAPCDVSDPVDWWRERVPAVARALAVADHLGAPPAPAVRAAAQQERDRRRAEGELRSGLAGVRATAWLLTAMPPGGAAVATVLTPPGSTSGLAVASTVAGLVLTGVGWAIIARLVARVRREADA